MNTNVYEIITQEIIKRLDSGVIPWRKPWRVNGIAPSNLISGKSYRGINTFLLGCQGYTSPYWLTFKQADQLGGSVKAGQHGSVIIYWSMLESSEVDVKTGKPKTWGMMRYYRVFNVSQCNGIKHDRLAEIEKTGPALEPIAEAEKLYQAMSGKPDVVFGLGHACYIPSSDKIEMPDLNTFEHAEEYYSTLFHELTHATGHEKRLNRHKKDSAQFNMRGQDYAKEELVAEMGAGFLCGMSGIDGSTLDNSAAYIATWRDRIAKDNKLVVSSASQAQKSVEYYIPSEVK